MLKNKELTAETARKLVDAKAKISNPLLEEVLSKNQEKAAEKGDMAIVIDASLSQNVLSALSKRGFKVGRMLYSNNSIRISWE